MQDLWTKETLVRYLSVYYNDTPDWGYHLGKLKTRDKNTASVRNKVAYTILTPYLDKTKATDPPEALLFAGFKFNNFEDRDWVSTLTEIYEEDKKIEESRNKLFSETLIIHPIEYHPRSRQTFVWMTEEAKFDSSINKDNIASVYEKLKNILYIYGPTSVCQFFQKKELKAQYIADLHTWRSGYFLERNLHKHYTVDELIENKKSDINRAPEELVKRI